MICSRTVMLQINHTKIYRVVQKSETTTFEGSHLLAHIFCLRHRDRIVTIDYYDVTASYLLIPYSLNLSCKVAPPGETE